MLSTISWFSDSGFSFVGIPKKQNLGRSSQPKTSLVQLRAEIVRECSTVPAEMTRDLFKAKRQRLRRCITVNWQCFDNEWLCWKLHTIVVFVTEKLLIITGKKKYDTEISVSFSSLTCLWYCQNLKLQLHDEIYRRQFYSKSLSHILSLSNSHNNVASIQKKSGL